MGRGSECIADAAIRVGPDGSLYRRGRRRTPDLEEQDGVSGWAEAIARYRIVRTGVSEDILGPHIRSLTVARTPAELQKALANQQPALVHLPHGAGWRLDLSSFGPQLTVLFVGHGNIDLRSRAEQTTDDTTSGIRFLGQVHATLRSGTAYAEGHANVLMAGKAHLSCSDDTTVSVKSDEAVVHARGLSKVTVFQAHQVRLAGLARAEVISTSRGEIALMDAASVRGHVDRTASELKDAGYSWGSPLEIGNLSLYEWDWTGTP